MTRERLALFLFAEFLAAFALASVAVLAVRFSQPATQAPEPEALSLSGHAIYDRPLLTNEQMREATEYGRAAFWFDGTHYVVEDIPIEYTFKE